MFKKLLGIDKIEKKQDNFNYDIMNLFKEFGKLEEKFERFKEQHYRDSEHEKKCKNGPCQS